MSFFVVTVVFPRRPPKTLVDHIKLSVLDLHQEREYLSVCLSSVPNGGIRAYGGHYVLE